MNTYIELPPGLIELQREDEMDEIGLIQEETTIRNNGIFTVLMLIMHNYLFQDLPPEIKLKK